MVVVKINLIFIYEYPNMYNVGACTLSCIYLFGFIFIYQFFFPFLTGIFMLLTNHLSFSICTCKNRSRYLPPRIKDKRGNMLQIFKKLLLFIKICYYWCVTRRLLKWHTLRVDVLSVAFAFEGTMCEIGLPLFSLCCKPIKMAAVSTNESKDLYWRRRGWAEETIHHLVGIFHIRRMVNPSLSWIHHRTHTHTHTPLLVFFLPPLSTCAYLFPHFKAYSDGKN